MHSLEVKIENKHGTSIPRTFLFGQPMCSYRSGRKGTFFLCSLLRLCVLVTQENTAQISTQIFLKKYIKEKRVWMFVRLKLSVCFESYFSGLFKRHQVENISCKYKNRSHFLFFIEFSDLIFTVNVSKFCHNQPQFLSFERLGLPQFV